MSQAEGTYLPELPPPPPPPSLAQQRAEHWSCAKGPRQQTLEAIICELPLLQQAAHRLEEEKDYSKAIEAVTAYLR